MSNDKKLTAAAVATVIAGFALSAWILMLVIGALHHEVSDNIPAVSYGGSVLLYLAANLLVGGVRASRNA